MEVKNIVCTLIAATAICATSATMATDLENFYFRYDFSDGTKQFIGSSSQTSDPVTASAEADKFVAAYGQDGAATAVHISSTAYGSDKIAGSSTMNNGWTVAMSLRPGSVDKGLLFSVGKANANNSKCVFVASSDTAGKLYAGTVRKKGSANNYTGSVDRELAKEWGLTAFSADTTTGYHTIVIVHVGSGVVDIYCDGELAGEIDTTDNAAGCTFGNGIQFNQAHGSSTFLGANGYSQSHENPDVAFQDVRFYNSAFTAEDAAAYAALYPATLPGFSNLDQYAFVQSYGVNGVDTGVYMTDTDKFTADFAFTDVSYKSWLCGAGKNANKQTHAIYLNGSQQLAWTTRGEWWWSTWPSAKIEGSTIQDTRLVMTVESSLKAHLTYYGTRTTKSSDASTKTATSAGPSIIPTHLFRANTMMDNDGQACRAKIYSFEVDADSSTITPRAFFAPTTDANGAVGFANVVAGTFHGECLPSPSTALTFTSGIGRAEDYRYRSGKFYSRIYASSADAAKGLVKFEDGEAAGTNAQFTARGKTARISAVSLSGESIGVKWSGDTWAIVSGTVNDATIEVKSDTAVHLVAAFAFLPKWTNADGTASLDSVANWTQMPESGDDVVLELDGDTAITSSGAKTFGKMVVKGACGVDFSGAETMALSGIELSGVTNLVTGGKLRFTAMSVPADCTVTITGAEGLGNGGLAGSGTLVIDPGAGTTFTMSTDNTGFTGETVIKSGIVKFGGIDSFGPVGRDAFIRVKGGAVLDENQIYYYPGSGQKLSKAILEEGATLQANPGYKNATASELQYSVLTTIKLEGNATVDTSAGIVTFSERYHDHAVSLDLGTNTLTVAGGGTFGISYCTISGTGTLDIQSGTTVISTQDYDGSSTTTCANGTIRIREGGKWGLEFYHQTGSTANLSVKNLILDGSVTRTDDAFALTVTGSITGNGTTPMLAMGADAVFKPTGTGYLNVTTSLSGTMKIDLGDIDLSMAKGRLPLFKVGSPEVLPAAEAVQFVGGIPRGWRLEASREGFGYDIVRGGFVIIVK